jgi:hypothetical protein
MLRRGDSLLSVRGRTSILLLYFVKTIGMAVMCYHVECIISLGGF